MTSITTPQEPIHTAPLTPPLTWGALCAALEAGLISATVEDGAYVVHVSALRRYQPSRTHRVPRSVRA